MKLFSNLLTQIRYKKQDLRQLNTFVGLWAAAHFRYVLTVICIVMAAFIFIYFSVGWVAELPAGSLEAEVQEDVLSSGPVRELPWEEDEAFLEKQNECGANILMGAYRTVLRDPLPGEEYNVHLAASMLAGIVVKPSAIFSQNSSVGPYTTERGFRKGPTYIGSKLTTTIGGGVCKIASTLYNVSVLSDVGIVERHNHSMPVPYVPYGQDATVAFGVKDFKFRNNTSSPLMIWAMGMDNILYIAFYGRIEPPEIEWRHEFIETRPAGRIVSYSKDLAPGEERVKLQGMDGALINSWIILSYGDYCEIRFMGTSDYRPMQNIVEIGAEPQI